MGQTDRPTVAVFDASLGETPAERNLRRELGVDPVVYKVSDGQFPPLPSDPSASSIDGVVVSGSQTAVYEDRPWIARVEDWVRAAAAQGVPVLGICWGHQVLAQAFGGAVDPMGRYELGYEQVHRVADDELFEGVEETFVAFETHSDEVTRLPATATVLAENETALQAFRVGDAWGVQFHPEYDLETARWVTENKRGEVPEARIQEVLADVTPGRHAETEAVKRVFDNFLGIVERRAAARTPVSDEG